VRTRKIRHLLDDVGTRVARESAQQYMNYRQRKQREKTAFWVGFEKAAAARGASHEKHLARLAAHNETAPQRRSAHITYHKQSSGRVVKRRIDPLKVRGGLVIAYDHKRQAIRSFRLDRIRHVEKVPHAAKANRPKSG
jgi:predicted DNA-binding transcriptional regulator YafY